MRFTAWGARGKTLEQQRARELRAGSWTLAEIAQELPVSRSSVSARVRDVVFDPKPRQRPRFRNPRSLHLKKLAEIEAADAWARTYVDSLPEDACFAAGVALYAGEGAKTDHCVKFANTDPAMIGFSAGGSGGTSSSTNQDCGFVCTCTNGSTWTEQHWSEVTDVPRTHSHAPYRAKADASIRATKHVHGCGYVVYSCSTTHRRDPGTRTGIAILSEFNPG